MVVPTEAAKDVRAFAIVYAVDSVALFYFGKIGIILARTLAAFLNPDNTGKNSSPVF